MIGCFSQGGEFVFVASSGNGENGARKTGRAVKNKGFNSIGKLPTCHMENAQKPPQKGSYQIPSNWWPERGKKLFLVNLRILLDQRGLCWNSPAERHEYCISECPGFEGPRSIRQAPDGDPGVLPQFGFHFGDQIMWLGSKELKS